MPPRPLGETATIHQSILKPLLFWPGIPFQVSIVVGVATLLAILICGIKWPFLIFRVAMIGAGVYMAVGYALKHDLQLVVVLMRYLSYPSYLSPEQLASLLPWQDVVEPDEGILTTTDDGLMCVFRIDPYDMESLSPEERGAICLRLNEGLKRFDASWTFWQHGKRRAVGPIPPSAWPDPVSQLLDDQYRAELNAAGVRWFTEIYLTAWYKPQAGAVTSTLEHLTGYFYTGGEDTASSMEGQFETFRSGVRALERQLSTACHSVERLTGNALKTYLHGFISIDDHSVSSAGDTDLSYDLVDCGLWTGLTPMLGTPQFQEHLRLLTLTTDLPPMSKALMWKRLYELPLAYDWVTTLTPQTRAEAETVTEKRQLNLHATRKGGRMFLYERLSKESGGNLEDTHSEKLVKDANVARDVMLSDEAGLVHLSTIFVTRDVDETVAEARAAAIQSVLQSGGCVTRLEGLAATDVWFAHIPGQMTVGWRPRPNDRQLKMTTMNFVHLACFYRPYAGDETCDHLRGPVLTRALTAGCNPFGVNPYVGDVAISKHIGPKGSGKSTLLNWDGAQWGRYEGSQLLNWDVGGSAWCLTLCLGGAYHDVREDGLGIQLMSYVDRPEKHAWLLQWCCNRVWESGITKDPDITDYLWGGLRELWQKREKPRRLGEYLHILTAHSLTFGALAAKGNDRSKKLALMAPQVCAALRLFAWGSPCGHILDAPVDTFELSRVHTFELGRLIRLRDIQAGVLEALFERIRDNCHGQPVRGHFDECSHYWRSQAFVDILLEDMPDWRKSNFSAAFAAQSISQFQGTPLEALLIESCEVDYWYPSAKVRAPRVAQLYREMGLTDEDIGAIASGTPKEEVLQVKMAEGKRKPGGSRLIAMRLPPIAQAVCGSSSREDQRHIRDLVERYGAEEFPFRFLEVRGFAHEAKQIRQALARRSLDAPLLPVLDLVASR
jgi:type IV secretion system protein TrbE